MFLQHCGSQQSTDRAKNILFYALWALYVLTMATSIFDIIEWCWIDAVSMDDHRCLSLFQLIIQNIEILYHLQIIEVTLLACCDFIAQIILVCTTGNCYRYSSNFLKDISLLDCLGLQHSCCDRSILSICILTSINLSSFTD